LRQRNGREQVNIDNPLIDRQIGIDCWRPLRDARIIHQHVDMTLKRNGFGHFVSQAGIIHYIKWQNQTAFRRTRFRCDALQFGDIAPGQYRISSAGNKRLGQSFANARRCPCDPRGFV
jgi:hypothetical protein